MWTSVQMSGVETMDKCACYQYYCLNREFCVKALFTTYCEDQCTSTINVKIGEGEWRGSDKNYPEWRLQECRLWTAAAWDGDTGGGHQTIFLSAKYFVIDISKYFLPRDNSAWRS